MKLIFTYLSFVLASCSPMFYDVSTPDNDVVGYFECVEHVPDRPGLNIEAVDLNDNVRDYAFSVMVGRSVVFVTLEREDEFLYGEFHGIDCFSNDMTQAVIIER